MAGVVVGCLVAAGLVAGGILDRRSGASAGAIGRFLDDYERSRAGTYALEGEFTRTSADGGQLRSALFIAQRPPDRVRRQLGSVSGRLGDGWLNCATDPDGRFQCAASGRVAPFDEEVAADVSAMATHVQGERPAYTVRAAGDRCYDLELAVTMVDPLYGSFARMCFDEATGAMVYLEVRRADGSSDVLTVSSVRPQVSDLDLVVEADDRFAPEIIGQS